MTNRSTTGVWDDTAGGDPVADIRRALATQTTAPPAPAGLVIGPALALAILRALRHDLSAGAVAELHRATASSAAAILSEDTGAELFWLALARAAQAPSEAFGPASPPGTSAADAPGVETGLGAPVVLTPEERAKNWYGPMELLDGWPAFVVRESPEERAKAGVKRAVADFMRANR